MGLQVEVDLDLAHFRGRDGDQLANIRHHDERLGEMCRRDSLHTDEILVALSICAVSSPVAELAMKQLEKLRCV